MHLFCCYDIILGFHFTHMATYARYMYMHDSCIAMHVKLQLLAHTAHLTSSYNTVDREIFVVKNFSSMIFSDEN